MCSSKVVGQRVVRYRAGGFPLQDLRRSLMLSLLKAHLHHRSHVISLHLHLLLKITEGVVVGVP